MHRDASVPVLPEVRRRTDGVGVTWRIRHGLMMRIDELVAVPGESERAPVVSWRCWILQATVYGTHGAACGDLLDTLVLA